MACPGGPDAQEGRRCVTEERAAPERGWHRAYHADRIDHIPADRKVHSCTVRPSKTLAQMRSQLNELDLHSRMAIEIDGLHEGRLGIRPA